MISSIIITILFIAFSICCVDEKKQQNALFLLGVLLMCFYFFVDLTKLPDIEAYISVFNQCKGVDITQIGYVDTYMEPGYLVLNILISKVSGEFRFFYLIYGLIVTSSFTFLIKRYSPNYWFSGVLLICTSFSALFLMREHLAISICIFSIPFIIDRKPIYFLAFMVLSFLFHRSSIIFSVLYFVPYFKSSFKSFIVVGLLGLIMAKYLDTILERVLILTDFRHLESYIIDDYSNSWKAAIMCSSSVVYAVFCYGKKIYNLTRVQMFFLVMVFIAVILSIIDAIGTSFAAFYRIIDFFEFVSIILIPDATRYIKNNYIRIPMVFLWILISVYSLFRMAEQQGFGLIF